MKKPAALFIYLFLFIKLSYAQDTLILRNASKLVVNVKEVALNDIKYVPFGRENAHSITIDKNYVDYIIYADGNTLHFDETKTDDTDYNSTNLYVTGQKDASKYYTGYKPAATGTLVVSLLSPLVGLIPALGCSLTPPHEKNLEYPNSKLFQQKDYQHGYIKEAKKKKSHKVWANWGIGLGVNIVLAIVLAN